MRSGLKQRIILRAIEVFLDHDANLRMSER
jgi:hypothetical protein